MSGGEQQVLAVARALMGRPRLLMLDEPSLGLAPRMLDELLGMVRRIRDDGVTVLLVEQNVAKALAIAQDGYVIERGRVVMKGEGPELLRSEHLRTSYLGAHAGKEMKSKVIDPTWPVTYVTKRDRRRKNARSGRASG